MIHVIGIGGHARVVMDILDRKGVQVSFEDFSKHPGSEIVIAIGDNHKRKEISENLCDCKFQTIIHPSAIVSKFATIGEGTIIGPNAIVNANATIGKGCIINTSAIVEHDCVLEDYVHIAPRATLCGRVHVGECTLVGVGSNVIPNIHIGPNEIVRAGSTITQDIGKIPMSTLDLDQTSIQKTLSSGWITWSGPYVKRCERWFETKFDIEKCVLVSNGSVACHCMALALKKFKPHVKHIYMPDYVYIAAWNAFMLEFPTEMLHILSVDPKRLNITIDQIETLPEDSAVLIVHNVGHVVDVPAMKERRPDIVFVEDNCEGLGGVYPNGKPTGTAGFCSAVSFFANKIVTSGEGGAFLTQNKEVGDYVWHISHQGQTEIRYIHDTVAYNYRITNLQAALLWDQLKVFDSLIDKRLRLIREYKKNLSDCEVLFEEGDAPWIVVIKSQHCQTISEQLKKNGIETRPMFFSAVRHRHTKHISSDTHPIVHEYYLMLPLFASMTIEQVQRICNLINSFSS